jgi:transcriptional regulator with XRE-family HTH domain
MEHINYAAIGAQIRRRRRELRLTQEVLAEKADIAPSYLGHVERGTRKPSVETLVHLAEALNVCLCALIPMRHAGGQEGEYKLLVSDILELIQTRTGGGRSRD